jgi:hypothetical protein
LKKQVQELEASKETEELEAERDEAIRDKKTLEQDLIATANRLKLKVQELENREKEMGRLKKEAGEKDKNLNEKITELKKKYQDKVKQFDEEQLEHNKLIEKVETLEQQISELKRAKSPLPGS